MTENNSLENAFKSAVRSHVSKKSQDEIPEVVASAFYEELEGCDTDEVDHEAELIKFINDHKEMKPPFSDALVVVRWSDYFAYLDTKHQYEILERYPHHFCSNGLLMLDTDLQRYLDEAGAAILTVTEKMQLEEAARTHEQDRVLEVFAGVGFVSTRPIQRSTYTRLSVDIPNMFQVVISGLRSLEDRCPDRRAFDSQGNQVIARLHNVKK